MGQRVRQINGLVIDEISLVDKGANQHATVTIAKSADGEEEQQMDIFDEQGNPLDAEELSDGDVVFDAEGNGYRFEVDDAEGEYEEEEEQEPVPVGKSYENPFRRHADSVSKSYNTTSFADQIREELSKSLTDRDRDEVITKALGRFEELSKAAERAEEVAKAERTLRLEREYTEIAKSFNLPIQDEVLGGVLMRCAEALPSEDCEIIAKCLEAASENIFAEQGYVGGGDNSDVLAQADAVIQKSSDRPDAMVEYFASNPEAYDEYLAEKRG